ncbi:MAG: DegV family protein [Candidatus Cloacimonetes bacterium]|nr:DegV family protein [Candidatus Cloacimonadota bacterium]
MQIKYLDGKRFYRGLVAGSKAVIENQNYLNKINVFPVADADTGINLALTMKAMMDNSRIGKTLKDTLISVADSALSGARGNSGIIFAQYLYGLSYELPVKGVIGVKHFAQSAQKAVQHLYASLMNPVEGTMLTVIREWAEYLVEQSNKTSDFLHVFTDSLAIARKSLQDTPAKLKVLADAGVVDAGACGFVYFLEGVVSYMHEGSLKENMATSLPIEVINLHNNHATAPDKYRYCSEAMLSKLACPLQKIKGIAETYGDSIILAGGEAKLHLHIHTNEPDKLFAELFELAHVSNMKVDDMLLQYQISNARKYPIGLVTDTASDLPQAIIDEYQIMQIPFGITVGDRVYLDKFTIKPERFYGLLDSAKTHPFSSQPSLSLVKNTIDYASNNFEKVIAVHISEKLSGVFNSTSSIVAKSYASRMGVINSRHLSVSEGLVTLRIARAIAAGMSFETIMAEAPLWIENTKILTDINTLKYMVRGGRVKPLAGFMAAVLNLKPIVSLDREGKALAYGKSFSRKSNMAKIIGIVRKDLQGKKMWEYAIVHAEAEERALQYAELLQELTGKKPAYIMPLSPVVGVHNGIGTVGIGVSYD